MTPVVFCVFKAQVDEDDEVEEERAVFASKSDTQSISVAVLRSRNHTTKCFALRSRSCLFSYFSWAIRLGTVSYDLPVI